MGDYKGRPSFTFDKINVCKFPENFVKKDKYKKPIPREYKTIFPTSATSVKISSVFDMGKELPKELTEKTYVVFDLETTGLEVLNEGITEIGAVKLVGGKMTEQFTTLVKPDYRITEKNIEITGITPEMVENAPKISKGYFATPKAPRFAYRSRLLWHSIPSPQGVIGCLCDGRSAN